VRTDVVYEVIDMRDDGQLDGVATIKVDGGNLLVSVLQSDKSVELEWNEDDTDAFVDDEVDGMIEVVTKEGRVVFQKLTLVSWLRNVEPFLTAGAPKFQSERELYGYLGAML